MKLTDTILAEPFWKHICFAEADTGDAGGGAPSPTPADAEADALAEALQEGEAPPPAEDDEAELEIGPDKIKVKKVVKDAWDGLQKSVQTRAEEMKTEKANSAAAVARAQEHAQVIASVVDEIAELKGLDKTIDPYLKLTPSDWMAWSEQDPDAARKAQTGLQAMLMQRQQLAGKIENKVKDAQEKQTTAQKEFRERAERELSTKIKDWSPAKREELIKHGAERGFSSQEIEPFLYDPRVVEIIQDAMTLRAARARVAAKNAAPAPAETEPQPKVRATGGGGNPLGDNVPIDQWARNFRKSMKRG